MCPLLNFYTSFKTPLPSASQNQLPFLPGPTAFCHSTMTSHSWPPPLPSTLAPAPCSRTAGSMRTGSKPHVCRLSPELLSATFSALCPRAARARWPGPQAPHFPSALPPPPVPSQGLSYILLQAQCPLYPGLCPRVTCMCRCAPGRPTWAPHGHPQLDSPRLNSPSPLSSPRPAPSTSPHARVSRCPPRSRIHFLSVLHKLPPRRGFPIPRVCHLTAQRSQVLKLGCRQRAGWVPSGGFGEESTSLPFLASRPCPRSLAPGSVFYLQGQQDNIF